MIKISKPIIKLLTELGLNIYKLSPDFKRKIFGSNEAKKNDFDYTLTSNNGIYCNNSFEKVSIKEVIGTTSKQDDNILLNYISELYTDRHEYGRRSLVYLNSSIPDNIDSINRERPEQAIKTIKINDKVNIFP